jgi:hypothetical protein
MESTVAGIDAMTAVMIAATAVTTAATVADDRH